MEKSVELVSGGLKLEALYLKRSKERGALILHPHPLYGGEMHNHVVEAMAEAFSACGFSTLRFNFRGAGKSQGEYDNGIGEAEDLLSAYEFLKGEGVNRMAVAGYSFGAWVISKTCRIVKNDDEIIFIAPPVAVLPFEKSLAVNGLKLVLCAERDRFAPPEKIQGLAKRWNHDVDFLVIKGTDHFFSGKKDIIRRAIKERFA